MATTLEVREFIENKRSPFAEWIDSLDEVTRARIDKYIYRLASGNFGSSKTLQEGVLELKMDFGPRLPGLFRTRRQYNHHFTRRRQQTTASRRYCSRNRAMEKI